ncbi:MAG: dynamin family protein [Bacteroidia bacterium]|nr:dynamin family protein [Bacteroidia bacterium]
MKLVSKSLQAYRIHLEEIAKQLHQLAIDIHNNDLASTISELRNTINEPFLFVIVGEVKAGKSSFINALLGTGEEIVKVAPEPCTDTIQQVIFGEEADEIEINKSLKKIIRPVEILKDISVVDTPGTNTISDEHEEITEGFVPRSDLIVFVFEAKNPYRQSAWTFFDYIHKDWQKKVIFVLQQADLMEEPDLQVNIQGVTDYAIKKGVDTPNVFAVSAKMELEGKQEESGFRLLNEFIQENIISKNAYLLKLGSSLDTSRNLLQKIQLTLSKLENQIQEDQAFRDDVLHTLAEQEERSNKQVDKLAEALLGEYDRITSQSKRDLSQGLGFFRITGRSFRSIFSRNESPKRWLESLTKDLELELEKNFTHKLQEGIEEIADSISQMARIINLKVQNKQAILKQGDDIFGVISERRRSVLRELRDRYQQFMKDTDSFVDKEVFPQASSFSPDLATGSGIAVIGAVLAAITAFDITGGIISAVGLLFAGGSIALRRGKIINGFGSEIKQGRKQLKEELLDKLKAYVQHIRRKIDQNFEDYDKLLENEKNQFQALITRYKEIEMEMDKLEKEIPKK